MRSRSDIGNSKTATRLAVTLLAVCLLGATDDPERELREVREKIQQVQIEIEKQTELRDRETAALREVEEQVAAAAAKLRSTRGQIRDGRARQSALKAQVEAGKQRLERDRNALADQIRAVYTSGRAERLRLLMNQEDPARVGRILAYYRYVTEARVDQIHRISAELDNLARAERQLAENTARLESLAVAQTEGVRDLEAARTQRTRVVARLETRIKDRQGEAARLSAEAEALEKLIEELRRTLIELPGADRPAFSTMKGQLEWPTGGLLVNDFGQSRAGGSNRWNGVVIGTDRGMDVRAIYHGRVAYADWLPGMGLLMVIEHGDGYMSLYGHNETLYKRVGDWVAPGEVIAGVGDTGGRSRSALYFEIRKDGRPRNPHSWFRNRLPGG